MGIGSEVCGAFTDESTASGSMFAAYSSMALLAAARNDQANHLIRALETNREIGVAMGIMMAGGKLTQQAGVRPVADGEPEFEPQVA